MSSPVVLADGSTLLPGPPCVGCSLEHAGTGFMQPAGNPYSGVVFVGEALGEQEAKAGAPFVGAAGFCLSRLFRWAKWRRDHFGIANVVWCRPPGNDLDAHTGAIDSCHPYLAQYLQQQQARMPMQTHWPAITKRQPDGHVTTVHDPVSWFPQQLVVVALGNRAFEHMTGWSGVSDNRGYVYWSAWANCWVVPSFHPAYLLRGNLNQSLWLRWDIEKALALTKFKPSANPSIRPSYMPLVDPSGPVVADFVGRYKQALAQNPNLVLAIDIENPHGVMTRISFCFGPTSEQTLSLAWASYYLPVIKDLLMSPGPKAAWNRGHDLAGIGAEGIVVNGLVHDPMNGWHALHSDLEKALVNVVTRYMPYVRPWKHLFKTDLGFYNAMDSLGLWICFEGIKQELAAAGMLHIYERHMVQIDQVTSLMSKAGVQVDPVRQKAESIRLGSEQEVLELKMQDVVPVHLRPLEPKAGYVKPPADTTGLEQIVVEAEVKVCSNCMALNPLKAHFIPVSKNKPAVCPDGQVIKIVTSVIRWAKRLPFVPSTQQLVRYAQYKNHKVFKHWSTGSVTMDDEALERLVKKYPDDPLYPLVREHRGIQKEKSTYVDVPTSPTGTLHTTFNHKPSTLRFGSEDPNMQNWPPAARALIIPRPGMVFWKRDYSAIEAQLVGYEAQDPTYIRMSKLGIHDWVLCHYLHTVGGIKNGQLYKIQAADMPQTSWSDSDLKAYLGSMKKQWPVQREMCKRIVHLSNYLGTAEKIYQLYPKEFGSFQNCYALQQFYFELFPAIPKWHWNLCMQVEDSHYATNAYGYRHFFFAPFDYDPTDDGWERKWGPDAKRLIAMKPQGTAAAIMKEAMLMAHADPLVGPTLRLTIHDELFGECYPHELDEVQARAKAIMETPMPWLPLDPAWGLGTHLSIGTEGKSGFRWSDMTTELTSEHAELYALAEVL